MNASTLLLVLLGLVTLAPEQTAVSPPPLRDKAIKIGIFPFADATASGNRSVGADVGRTMASEFTHSTTLMPRILGDSSTRAEDLDGEKAIAIGREQNVDLVFMGTVLDAKTQESNKSGWLPSIKGQSGSVSLRRVKATVTLQASCTTSRPANASSVFASRATTRTTRWAGRLTPRSGRGEMTAIGTSSTRLWARPCRWPLPR
jgi:hypothetical protein